MSKRRYTKVQILLPQIEIMMAEGMSHTAIEKELGLEGDRPIHNLLKRQRRKEEKQKAGLEIRPKGRPRKDSHSRDIVAEQAYEIQRLKMENKLLRDFLRSTERKRDPSIRMRLSSVIVKNIRYPSCVGSSACPGVAIMTM